MIKLFDELEGIVNASTFYHKIGDFDWRNENRRALPAANDIAELSAFADIANGAETI